MKRRHPLPAHACAALALFAAADLAGCTASPPIPAAAMVAEDRAFEDQKTDATIKVGILTDINNRKSTAHAALPNVDVCEQRVLLTGAVETADARAKDTEDMRQVMNHAAVRAR